MYSQARRHPLGGTAICRLFLEKGIPPMHMINSGSAKNSNRLFALTGLISALIVPISAASFAASPPSPYPILSEQGILKGVTIEAPFSDLFKMTRAMPDGKDLPKDKLPKGKITFQDASGKTTTYENVTLSVRGNSSKRLDQCPFAKLTLRFPKGDAMPVMGELRKIKIGTHCGETDEPGPEWFRTRNQKSPVREALIYKILTRTDTVSLLARPAVITYTDTSATVDAQVLPARTITRAAFFLEDDETAAERYGGKILQEAGPRPPNAPFMNARDSKIAPRNIALSVLAEALTENVDWYIQMSASDPEAGGWHGYSNWNVNIMQTKDGKVWSMVYDWDISAWVTNHSFGARFEDAIARMAAYPDLKQDDLDKAIQQYISAKTQIYKDVDEAFAQSGVVDSEGKTFITQRLDSFYKTVEDGPVLRSFPPPKQPPSQPPYCGDFEQADWPAKGLKVVNPRGFKPSEYRARDSVSGALFAGIYQWGGQRCGGSCTIGRAGPVCYLPVN